MEIAAGIGAIVGFIAGMISAEVDNTGYSSFGEDFVCVVFLTGIGALAGMAIRGVVELPPRSLIVLIAMILVSVVVTAAIIYRRRHVAR
jgi:ABC-type iron transport system FetAB permease component